MIALVVTRLSDYCRTFFTLVTLFWSSGHRFPTDTPRTRTNPLVITSITSEDVVPQRQPHIRDANAA